MKKTKKILGIVGCIALIPFLSGCEKQAEEKIITCTLYKKDVVSNYELNSTYKVYAKGKVVNKVETTEIINSESDYIIEYFEETLKTTYSAMDKAYGGYDIEVTKEGNKVTSVTTINYNELNIDQLAKDEASIKAILTKDNKVSLDGIKSLYEQMGAECK